MGRKYTAFSVIVFLLLMAAGIGAIYYVMVPPNIPENLPSVSFCGEASYPTSGQWHTQLAGPYLVKNTNVEAQESKNLGKIAVKRPRLEIPDYSDGCTVEMVKPFDTVSTGVFEGSVEDFNNFEFTENGDYVVTVNMHLDRDELRDAADLSYMFMFTLDVQPRIEISSDRALQGDILSVFVDMGFEKSEPTLDSVLGAGNFMPVGDGLYRAYIPVNYDQHVDAYDIYVNAGTASKAFHVVITSREFEEQHMTISSSTVASTTGEDANKDYAEKIKSLWDVPGDSEKYWTEPFIQPVEGRISTQYGLFRYTNGSTTATRHKGIDIAAAADTPAAASNSGRVIFAGEVIMTGNTVVIEHGGGLRTYYYHLNRLNCKEGDMVKRGDIIGLVGSTGYSTGPHLHFQVQIGSACVSPWELFDGTSDIYKE